MNKLEALKHFCVVAETLNFREASVKLAVSPQVVTRMIAELEEALGESLFKRNTRNVNLTPFGHAFLPKAEALLKDSEALFVKKHHQLETDMAGIVRITLPPLLDNQRILQALLEALKPYPKIVIDWQVDMKTVNSITNHIDIGVRVELRSSMQPDPNLIVREVGSIQEFIVASPKLIKTLGMPKDLDDLINNYPLSNLLNSKTGRAWNWVLNKDTQFINKHPAFITNNIHSELLACTAGRVISLLPDNLCQPYIDRGELQVLFIELTPQISPLYIYRPRQAVTSNRVLKVFDLLTQVFDSVI